MWFGKKTMAIMTEIKVKGVVLPGRALAGQKRRQHMKEKEKKTLDSVCQALSHISAHL